MLNRLGWLGWLRMLSNGQLNRLQVLLEDQRESWWIQQIQAGVDVQLPTVVERLRGYLATNYGKRYTNAPFAENLMQAPQPQMAFSTFGNQSLGN